MYEMFSYMNDLILHAREHPEQPIQQSLGSVLESYSKQTPGQQQKPQNPALLQMQQHAMNRMPNGPMMSQQGGTEGFMAMSPAMQPNMLANGSPHLGGGPHAMGIVQSPAPAHMAPPMVAQKSQQGSASGRSTNTSPSMQGKRRRSTAPIKNEDGEVNGAVGKKVKPSPQMNKRAKQS
jgi:hypothetical protein